MMSSITPVGEVARGQRWSMTAAAYLVGSALGGLALGGVAALASLGTRAVLDDTAALLVLALVATLGVLADRGVLPLPTWRRQVDDGWMHTYRGWVYGFGFGIQLGAGVLTIITSAIVWVMVAAAALAPEPGWAIAVGGTFGLVRALPVLLFARATSPSTLHDAFRSVERWREPAQRVSLAAQALVAVGALAAAVA